MSSFINKSGKKLAPKAPSARRRPGAPALVQASAQPSSVRSSVERQTSVQPTASGDRPQQDEPRIDPGSEAHTQASNEAAVQTNAAISIQPQERPLPTPPSTQIITASLPTPPATQPIPEIPNPQAGTSSSNALPPSTTAVEPTRDTVSEILTTNTDASDNATLAAHAITALSQAIAAESAQQETSARIDAPTAVADPLQPIASDQDPSTTRDNTQPKTTGRKRKQPAATGSARPAKRRSVAPADGEDGVEPTTEAGTNSEQTAAARRKAKGKGRATSTPADSTTKARKPRKKRATTSATVEGEGEQDGELVEGETTRRGKQRQATPESAEEKEIDPGALRMHELAADLRIGKKSNLERRMGEIDWDEVKKRRKEEIERITQPAQEVEGVTQEAGNASSGGAQKRSGPGLVLVNGNIEINQNSLLVDRHAEATRDNDTLQEVEENDLTTRVNSQSWMNITRKDPAERRPPGGSESWNVTQTDRFYDALRMFGTDFYIISRMFPGKTRRQIKSKFVREEREDPARINSALLGQKVPMDMDTYLAATGGQADQFKDPRALEEEFRIEHERHKEEIERAKANYEEMQKQKAAAESGKENEAAGKKKKRERKKKPGFVQGGEEAEVLGLDE